MTTGGRGATIAGLPWAPPPPGALAGAAGAAFPDEAMNRCAKMIASPAATPASTVLDRSGGTGAITRDGGAPPLRRQGARPFIQLSRQEGGPDGHTR